ncbi:hypothetical protein [Clostridium sp. YIM B02500]|uniref:hypothetical protein n=1 Tax=Clostridium sp. YIM B02500 TaxID=2910681 RepID=UPI001EEF7849|nr:hypothetical protein [Clostridium sp. YIM B02500]
MSKIRSYENLYGVTDTIKLTCLAREISKEDDSLLLNPYGGNYNNVTREVI